MSTLTQRLQYRHPFIPKTNLICTESLWRCCKCHQTNILTPKVGQHPFSSIVCTSCQHVLCYECQSTKILHLLFMPSDTEQVRAYDSPDEAKRFGSLCAKCGLTHASTCANLKEKTSGWITGFAHSMALKKG